MTRFTTRLTAVASLAAAAALTVALTGCQTGTPGGEPDAGSGYVTDGKLTIGTGEPAFEPWVVGDPTNGEGFEAAVAYAVAEQLGFSKDDVVWVGTTFDEAIAPGPKNFDFNLQQFSITDDRKANIDFSTPYYETTQVVLTTGASPAADASSLADLKPLLLGAQVGTTSFDAIEQQIQPDQAAHAFNTNEDAQAALEAGQVDAIVVDLPTAFYLRDAELTDGKIVGQLPKPDGKSGDEFGLVLAKDSPLTATVSAAVDALREDGTLQELADTWLAGSGGAPVLQ